MSDPDPGGAPATAAVARDIAAPASRARRGLLVSCGLIALYRIGFAALDAPRS